MRKLTGITIILFFLTTGSALAGIDYNYVDSNSLMQSLQAKKAVHLVDIQKKNDFLQHHFSTAIATSAYPVKSEQDTGKIKAILADLQATSDPVVIVGPRGTRASKKAYAYLLKQGIAPQRLAILENGVRGWPAKEILLNTSGQ